MAYIMIGSLLTRGLVMLLGYAYPAYECYKTVELNKPDIEQLRFWCQYWILVALLTVGERIGDTFVSWVPMYSEARLAFYIYLWYPKTKGTTYVYDSFFKPYVAKHETDIDRNLLELRTRAGDYVVSYWLKAATYGQTRVYDILQYIASQSTPKSSSMQAKQGARGRPPTRRTAKSETEEPISPTSSSTSSDQQEDDVDDAIEESNESTSQTQAPPARKSNSQTQPPPATAPATANLDPQKSVATKSVSETIKPLKTTIESEVVVRASSLPSSSSPASNGNNADAPPVQDTVMEESIRVTRGRLRKTRITSVR